jgi:hypothetical protein
MHLSQVVRARMISDSDTKGREYLAFGCLPVV